MPLQRRKKKKKVPPKKSGGMSQVQNVKVVVNATPTPRRRRRAPAKKKDQGFSFGGGGGGGAGLAQVTYAPSLTQDVLQQSQELRQTIQQIQAVQPGQRPGSNTMLGEPGQPENPLIPDQLPVTREQLKFVMGSVIEQQSLQNRAMTQGFEQYKALAGQQLQALDDSIFALSTQKPEASPVARSESPVRLVPQPSPRGRSTTVRSDSMAAEAGTPPPTPKPTGRRPEVIAEMYDRHLENKKKKGTERLENSDLARAAGVSLATYEKIIGAEKKARK